MVPNSEIDLIYQINNDYFSLKRNFSGSKNIKTASLFNKAVEGVFNKWGHIFGFQSVSELKSTYTRYKKFLRNKNSIPVNLSATVSQEKKTVVVDELREQVKALGLSEDTYF